MPSNKAISRGSRRCSLQTCRWPRVTDIAGVSLRQVEVNGGSGALYLDADQRLLAVIALDVAGGQIRGINSIVNPEKLRHLGPVGDFASLLRSVG
jgi:hypothetical protein